MLYIFGGLPGTGKSTLASTLARQIAAVYLRIDTIEQALRRVGVEASGEGYCVAYAIAEENLKQNRDVVADSVNPNAQTRTAWRTVAKKAGVPYVELEVICSDACEHRQRVETRSSDIPDLKLPTWGEVQERKYQQWTSRHFTIDTAGRTIHESVIEMFQMIKVPEDQVEEK